MPPVSATGRGQVTIPKRVRHALGISAGSKVDFELQGQSARLVLVKRRSPTRVEDGPAILGYAGRRIPTAELHGGLAMKRSPRPSGRHG